MSPTTPAVEVVCLGEAMALMAPEPPGGLTEGAALRLSVAGAESNVALNLAGLGADTAWCGRVGADPFGAMIMNRLGDAGVRTGAIEVDPRAPTGVYFKDPHGATVYYYRSGSAASDMNRDFLARLPAAQVLHVSGITPALSPSCADLIGHLIHDRPHPGLLSFDVNYRAKLWPTAQAAPALLALADAADLVFVGQDEAAELWGAADPAAVRAALPAPETLVVKDGAVGATIYCGESSVFVPTPPVDVVEVVGAGDAFAAGYLYALLQDAPPAARLALGHLTAAQAIGVAGDVGAPPTAQDVTRTLQGEA